MAKTEAARAEAYGERGLTAVDRLGVWLSQRALRPHVSGDARVLDLGCGFDAATLRALASRIAAGTGVDLSISAEARAAAGLEFVEATIEDALPRLDAEAFDAVLLINVLEHLWEPLDILRSIHRVLAPGGAAIVNVPTWTGKTALELSAFRLGLSPAIEMDDHKAYYGRRELWPLLVRAGFAPSAIRLRYHKLGLNLFAVARRSA
jgi:SAM-dependent methyltransferase